MVDLSLARSSLLFLPPFGVSVALKQGLDYYYSTMLPLSFMFLGFFVVILHASGERGLYSIDANIHV